MPEFYDLKNPSPQYMEYTSTPPAIQPSKQDKPVKEGLSFSETNIATVYPKMKENPQLYDMDPSGRIVNWPIDSPNYIPTFNDTRLQDTQEMMKQENTIFAVTIMTGISLIALSFMIFKQQTSPSPP